MLIKVKMLTGLELQFDIEPTDQIYRIKELIEEKEGTPRNQQRLIFGGRPLEDFLSAADYKMKDGSSLQMIIRLAGCGCGCGGNLNQIN